MGRLLPVTVDENVFATPRLPTGGNPGRARTGRHFPMPRYPLLLIRAPSPIAVDPHVLLRGLRRLGFLQRCRWRLVNNDEWRRCHGGRWCGRLALNDGRCGRLNNDRTVTAARKRQRADRHQDKECARPRSRECWDRVHAPIDAPARHWFGKFPRRFVPLPAPTDTKKARTSSAPFCFGATLGVVAELIPVAFVEAPATAFRLPARRNPHGARARRDFPVAGRPLIVVGLPGPVARDPNVIGRRTRGRYFLLRGRGRLHHDDGAGAGRRGYRGDGGGHRGRNRGLINGGGGNGGGRWRRRSGNDVRFRLGRATGKQADSAANS